MNLHSQIQIYSFGAIALLNVFIAEGNLSAGVRGCEIIPGLENKKKTKFSFI